jgi:hypothetical protein
MNGVKYPAMRRRVMFALACLADREYQARVWVRREAPTPGYVDDFGEVVHALYDDCQVLPDPGGAVEWTLVEGDEIDALRRLGNVLTPLIDTIGDQPDTAYLAAPQWEDVVRHAAISLAAMVRAGAFSEG